jgi:hypothetical protein
MILYTIFDPNVVFNNGILGEPQADINYSVLNVDGIKVQVFKTNNTDLYIERVISTNPADYLNPKLQPGCLIKSDMS